MICSIITKPFAVFILLLFSCLSLSQTVVIGAQQTEIDNYRLWLDGKSCSEIVDYEHPLAYRSTTELLLLCKALHLGGMKPEIQLKPMPSYNRALAETRRGSITMHSGSAWRSTVSTEYYHISRALFKKKEFVKGLYVLPSKRKLIEKHIQENKNISANSIIRNYTVASST